MTFPRTLSAPSPGRPIPASEAPSGRPRPFGAPPVAGYEVVLLRVLAAEEQPPGLPALLDCINPCVGDLSRDDHWHARQLELVDALSRLRSRGLVEEVGRPGDPGGKRYVRTPLGRACVGR